MKRFGKLIIFLLAFQLEVRVKAEAPVIGVFSVDKTVFHLRTTDLKIHAAPGSTLEKTKTGDWKLLQGNLWVERAQHNSFETLFANVTGVNGEFWISAVNDEKIWVRNFSSDLRVTLRDGKSVDVPHGFQMWVSGLNSEAHSEYGMVEPIDMKAQIPQWYRIYPDGKKAFTAKMNGLKMSWGDVAETGSQIYKTQTLRKIASIENQEKSAADRKRRSEAETRRIRELYRSRVFDR
jgi:hypothetical protein